MLRSLRYLAEFVAAFAGVIVVLALLLAWRLSASPINSGFLTPYIQSGIADLIPDSTVVVAGSLLTWDSSARMISVHADGIEVSDKGGEKIAVIPEFDAKISLIGLMFGQFVPRDLSIDHPQFRLERDKDGSFSIGGRNVGGQTGGQGGDAPAASDSLRVVAQHAAHRLSHAVLLHKLAVTRAVFSVHDDMSQSDWSIDVPEISLERSVVTSIDHKLAYGALEGQMTVNVTQKDNSASVNIRYVFDPLSEEHSFSTLFSGLTPAYLAGGHPETLGLGAASIVDMPLSGKLHVRLDKNLDIDAAEAQIHGDEGHFVYADFWDQPCPVKSLDISADFNRKMQKMTVTDAQVDFGGPVLTLAVTGAPPQNPQQDMDYAATLTVENLPMNRYAALWPKPVLPDPRYWLEASLHDGTFTHAEVTAKGALKWSDLGNASLDEATGKVAATGARVIYLDPMPPAENVSAEASFDLKQMTVQITGGGIGNIRMQPFAIHITGLDKTDQDIDIPLAISGPMPEVMALIDHPPLGYAKALGIAPDAFGGRIAGTVDFKFPLLKTLAIKDVAIKAEATATDFASTKLVPGFAIDQGNLALRLDTDGFALNGPIQVNKVPFQITWNEAFETKPGKMQRQATLTGMVRDNQWNSLGIGAFEGTHGPVAVTLNMKRETKAETLYDGALDMRDAAMEVDQLGWKKAAGQPATLKFAATAPAGKPVQVTSIDLRGTGVSAAGKATLSPDMDQLLALDLSPLAVGRTNARLHFVQSFGDSGALSFTASGKSLDIAGLRGGKDPGRSDPRPKEYHIDVDKLYTGADGEIDQAKGFAIRDAEGWSAISLHGLADGDQPLAMDLSPQPDGHRTFSLTCDNFGKMMKGLGFTDTIRGGKFFVGGESTVDKPREIVGKAKINDFTVVNLPVLALLLNATSPFGFTGILTDSADFSKFTGEYKWSGDTLTLTKAHAAGSAIGININGRVDMNSGDANLQGTLVPFSVVNKFINYIPLIGDLITGGEDQGVLAVSYEIKGPLDKPDVSVNPMSLLTPGFIRNLFFGDDTNDEDDKE
ncbi:MAG: AsmA-like C-terminal domain-containing protein [Alphaproteobacteria bacterium]|nr:AsmA-like C-terminal domain-containing protein [Alphaproteobacteria bacterium]